MTQTDVKHQNYGVLCCQRPVGRKEQKPDKIEREREREENKRKEKKKKTHQT
jgi:hypothetical protein